MGSAVARALVERGRPVRALVRDAKQSGLPGSVEICQGTLEDAGSLERLVGGAGCVVHCAGKVKARSATEFMAANVDGTARLVAAMASKAPLADLLHISSLAARSPDVSVYAQSKYRAEQVVAGATHLQSRAIAIRPPAIYGPGDRNTLPILEQLANGIILVPRAPTNRFSLLHVADLAALVADLVDHGTAATRPLEPDDGFANGYRWQDLGQIAARVLQRRTRCVGVPRWLFEGVAVSTELFARATSAVPFLPRGKVAELFHPDWVADRATMRDVGWHARTGFDAGFASTLDWYYQAGWLKRSMPSEPGGLAKGTPRV